MKCSGRKALQPKNIFQTPKEDAFVVKAKAAELKENLIDASLAEELSAFKKKLERQREDRERTEKLLKERDGAMDVQMSLLLQRGETQKSLEIQVDRLFRLKELHAYSSVSLPLFSYDIIYIYPRSASSNCRLIWPSEDFPNPISESQGA